MPNIYPRVVEMTARKRTTNQALWAPLALHQIDEVGKFRVNTIDRTINIDLPPAMATRRIALHGFVPIGWRTDALMELPTGATSHVWSYHRSQEKNILSGLAYLTVHGADAGDPVLTAQIEPDIKTTPRFEDYVTITGMAGACAASMTLFGHFEDVEMEMEPAQVIIARSAALTRDDGIREQTIGCSIRVGGANVKGLGRVEIGMFGNQNPGKLFSMQAGTDFPAKMSLDVGKSYITPMGDFYRDNEVFEAEGLMQFPPFGKKFLPVEPHAPLRNAETGRIIGQITLKQLVPLCWVDPGETEFPSKAIANAHFEEEL